MLRLLVWAAAVGLLVAAATWLADRPGEAALQWRGWRVDTSAAMLFSAVAAVAAAAAVLYRLWAAAAAAPRRLRRFRRAARREKGYRALTWGLAAAAAGDAAEAARLARRADGLLGDPALTRLLSAQAAQLAGDEDGARRHFAAMLEDPRTAFPALRGLSALARRAGDDRAALDYARRAFALRPRAPWAAETLFDLLVRAGLWREALTAVETGIRNGVFAGAEGRRRRVVALLACSAEAGDSGEPGRAQEFARRAHSLAPEFLPATLRLLGLYVGGGRKRAAARLAHEAWAGAPHPELARLYLAIEEGGDAIARLRRLERLAARNPSDPESRLALAGAAVEAGLWGTARGHLDAAEAALGRDARLCRLRADVEEAERDDSEAARGWLLAAAEAPPGPGWICGGCGAAWRQWSPVCGGCEAFATLGWTRPQAAREEEEAEPQE